MAEYTQDSLKTKIEADLADNQAGGITAETLRNTLKHMVDSVIPITASGTDVYFRNDLDLRDNSIVTANGNISTIRGQWSGKDVATINFISGDDTTNRDNGIIVFKTAGSGIVSSTGGRGPVKRMAIDEKGQVLVYGSGTKYPAMHLKSIHGSGVNLVLDHAVGNIAVPDNKSMYFGHWASGTSIFTPRMSLGSTGKVGVGTTNALNSLHVRSSGSALRFDSKIASNDLANALIYKYKTG